MIHEIINLDNEPEIRKNLNKADLELHFNHQKNKCNICNRSLDITIPTTYKKDHIIQHAHQKSNAVNIFQIICSECHDWKTKHFDKIVIEICSRKQDEAINYISRTEILTYQLINYINFLIDDKFSFDKDKNWLKEGLHGLVLFLDFLYIKYSTISIQFIHDLLISIFAKFENHLRNLDDFLNRGEPMEVDL